MVRVKHKPSVAVSRIDMGTALPSLVAGETSVPLGKGHGDGPSPVELLASALAGCMALSLRYVIDRGHLAPYIRGVDVTVTAHKAEDLPSRVARMDVVVTLDADVEQEAADLLLAEAEKVCTVSNTLHGAGALVVEARAEIKS
ncbi:OsmC family protein [Zavarzinia sp. CC-PAN008]|uniref:OsmC family protein n=1 Tax=Zavarzinia sp. CC-PAN008 TaxID=3243332 RepID=UPI003F74822C